MLPLPLQLSTFLLLHLLLLSHSASSAIGATTYNILTGGGHPDGKTDSSEALMKAWDSACSSNSSSTIYVPKGRFLISSPVVFSGYRCSPKKPGAGILFRIDGTLVAPSEYSILGNYTIWLSFEGVTGVTISGGAIDARGGSLWACKAALGKNSKGCPLGISTLAFTNSKGIRVSGLTSLNSQLYHIVINGCKDVRLQGLKILASGVSPNTDGIHVQLSDTVSILNTKISTGDDCVSVGPGTTNLSIEKVVCGPGHGISIGSLAKEKNEAGVEGMTVKNTILIGTQNGVRIKSWGRPSDAFVKNILFQHITMIDVQNPIIIDQNYCPDNLGCPGKESGVKISDITYEDIHGTSATEVAVKFDCSPKNPCIGIKMTDVKLSYKDYKTAALSTCLHAAVSLSGVNNPTSSC